MKCISKSYLRQTADGDLLFCISHRKGWQSYRGDLFDKLLAIAEQHRNIRMGL